MASQTQTDFDKVLIWTTGALMPAVVGFLRVKAKKHFPIDVAVGYLTGAVIGLTVAELHKPGFLFF
jgi:membrane-associated phospholipid phosphatase